MSKIDQFENAIDHGISQGNEGINAAERQAIDDLLKEHRGILPERTRIVKRQGKGSEEKTGQLFIFLMVSLTRVS